MEEDWFWKDYLKSFQEKEAKILLAVLSDLTGRRGLSQEFSAIDDDIKKEIIDKCLGLISKELES